MLTSEFEFPYPMRLMATRPAPRGESRLMVVSRTGVLPSDFPLPVEREGWAFGRIGDLVDIIQPGDAVALNETKVTSSRLEGIANGKHEITLVVVKQIGGYGFEAWECWGNSVFIFIGHTIKFGSGLAAEVRDIHADGTLVLTFNLTGGEFLQKLEEIGEIPLPVYMMRAPDADDEVRYQSVFAKEPGSVAAPTASLHFSQDILDAIELKATIAKLVLHVGIGTFRSVQTPKAEEHPMHSESYTLPIIASEKLNQVRRNRGRVFAVGTTAARTLETCSTSTGELHAHRGDTSIFILPGYQWKCVDALLTNFHFPRSTLFMLVSSLLGIDRAKAAYAEAIRREFRLFSYGDAMLIL